MLHNFAICHFKWTPFDNKFTPFSLSTIFGISTMTTPIRWIDKPLKRGVKLFNDNGGIKTQPPGWQAVMETT